MIFKTACVSVSIYLFLVALCVAEVGSECVPMGVFVFARRVVVACLSHDEQSPQHQCIFSRMLRIHMHAPSVKHVHTRSCSLTRSLSLSRSLS